MLSFKDTVFLGVKGPKKVYLLHEMKSGQNLKGLEKYYSLSVGDLAYYNPEILNINAIPIGHKVNVSVPLSSLLREDNEMTQTRWRVVPLFYQVKSGETLFRIARIYFNMPIETLMARNGMENTILEPGQVLHIGWLDVKGIPPTARKYSGLSGEMRVINENLRKKYVADANAKKREVKQRGIAVWSKESSRDTKLYAMHRTAKIGTVIKVYAPAAKRTLYVKVMGKLSDNIHRGDVVLYLSPSAAKSLGAVNERLRVELSYFK